MQSFLQSRTIRRHVQAQIQARQQAHGQDLNHDNNLRPDYEVRANATDPDPQVVSADSTEPKESPLDPNRSTILDGTADSDAEAGAGALTDGRDITRTLTGVAVIHGHKVKPDGPIFVVSWHGSNDRSNPKTWSTLKRAVVTLEVGLISAVMMIASSITSAVLPQAADDFGVSKVVESLATRIFLMGVGVGSLVAGPFSETFGRNAVYGGSLLIFMAWILGSALAPNIGAQLAFRFLAGCSASTPIVCSGGTIADLWDSLEKTWSFFIYVSLGFSSAVIGPVIGAYIGPSGSLSWRWTEWITLILSGALQVLVFLFMPETYGPLLLRWKAAYYRRITGDDHYYAEDDLASPTFFGRLRISMTRPFQMITEPIVIFMTLYITILYIILFTFLIGWTYIFEETYQISQGLTHVIFIAMFIGMQLVALLIPFIHRKTAHAARMPPPADCPRKREGFSPELRLWFAMLGPAIAVPVSLFWMGWTARPSISIWSPILASVLFGFGMSGMFICIYLYVIDSYQVYSASALTFASVVRYLASGGMTVVGIPFYQNMGVDYTLTILACISLILVPVPYVLYFHGHRLRAKSKYAVAWE